MARRRTKVEVAQQLNEQSPRGTFAHIPEIIAREGRVKGFEELRDYTLIHWETLKGQINPYSAIKLALEADRHALFAEVAELRKQGDKAVELSGELQDYLKGNVDVAPDATGDRANIPTNVSRSSMYGDISELVLGETDTTDEKEEE